MNVVGWNVKLAAVMSLIALVASAITALTDGKPETIADWSALASQAGVVYALFFVRQNNVSTEAVKDSGTKVV